MNFLPSALFLNFLVWWVGWIAVLYRLISCLLLTKSRRYASIIQRLASSPSVTLVYWDHRGMANNWGVLQQPLNGDKIQLLVNKFRFEHMDALVLLQLMTSPRLRAISA